MSNSTTRLLKIAVALVVAAGLITALTKSYDQLTLPAHISYHWLGAGFLAAACFRIVNAHGWHLVLKALGANVSPTRCLKIWLTSEACRWLPGGIWGYGSRAVQATRAGVETSTAAASLIVELCSVISVACLVSACGFLMHHETFPVKETLSSCFLNPALLAGLSALTCFGFLIAFRLRKHIAKRFMQLKRKFPQKSTFALQWRSMPTVIGFYLSMAFLNGTITWCMIRAVDPTNSVPVTAVIAATSAAWLVGFFAFAAPGGMVVREAMLASLLVAWLPMPAAVTAAILARIAHIVAEASWVGVIYTKELVFAEQVPSLSITTPEQVSLGKANQ